MIVEGVVAFLGGLLSLLSPCSALLLPAFFAYAFASPGRLVLRTAIFYLGLLTLFVPLGLGVGALSSLVLEHRGEVTLVAGLLLIAIGAYQLAVGGFELPGTGSFRARVSGESAAATYTLGLVYGIGGFCSGPILGGVLTLASTSGGALQGAVLLAIFALGMVAPLLAIALAWERLGASGRTRLRGREIAIGPVRRHVTTVISSVMFILLGVGFIVFQGSNALGGLYASVGAADLALRLETAIGDTVRGQPLIATGATAALVGLAALILVRGRRRNTP
jgi:cytochrome c biogenesis protein CcdA